jgi:hypothetical protein
MASSTENLIKRNKGMSKEEEEEFLEKLLTKVHANDDTDDSDDDLPYGGKVFLARRRKPDSWLCIAIQVKKTHVNKPGISKYFMKNS